MPGLALAARKDSHADVDYDAANEDANFVKKPFGKKYAHRMMHLFE